MTEQDLDFQIAKQKQIIEDTENNWDIIILGTVGVLTLFIWVGFIILIIAGALWWDKSSKNQQAREELHHLEMLKAIKR